MVICHSKMVQYSYLLYFRHAIISSRICQYNAAIIVIINIILIVLILIMVLLFCRQAIVLVESATNMAV